MGGAIESEVTRAYNSLSGTDIRAVLGHLTFAEMQAISYSIHREKAPIYTMGSPDPRAFSRAKRGVAGSLICINFDRHAPFNLVKRAGGQFVANKDDIRLFTRSIQGSGRLSARCLWLCKGSLPPVW